ncbi:MAG: hypothetical protein ABIZ07_05885 [Dermatophilaceae bacterium]
MDFLNKILVALHLLGMAAIVGGWIVARTGSSFPASIVWGARAQLLTGVLLVGVAEANQGAINYPKIVVKLVIALVVVAMAEIGASKARKSEEHSTQLDVAGGGAVVNALVAALW